MFRSTLSKKNGLSLVEVLIAAAVITIFVGALITIHLIYFNIAYSGINKIKATLLAEEGIEAVKLLRDMSWTNNIAVQTTGPANYHYITYNSSKSWWATTTVNTFIDGLFERKYVLEDVYRDAYSDIASSGTLDSNTKKVTVIVAWREKNATTTKSIATYITNLFSN